MEQFHFFSPPLFVVVVVVIFILILGGFFGWRGVLGLKLYIYIFYFFFTGEIDSENYCATEDKANVTVFLLNKCSVKTVKQKKKKESTKALMTPYVLCFLIIIIIQRLGREIKIPPSSSPS